MNEELRKEGWEEILVDHQIINFEKIGDNIQGTYQEKRENVGQWDKTRYSLEVEGMEKYVYGTTDLNEKFKQINVGDDVMITLKKCIKSQPPKKPFKVFEVLRRPGTKTENGLQEEDDPEARTTIELILKELGSNASPKEISDYAEKVKEDWELTGDDITRIKLQLHRMGGK